MQRNLFILIITLLTPFLALAQQTAGVVHYEQVIDLKIDLPEEASPYAHLFPDSQTDHFVLRFTPEAAHYTMEEGAQAPEPIESEDGNVSIRIKVVRSGDHTAVFTDLADGSMVEQRDIFGRPFRIRHELDAGAWKLTNEQKVILGYTCMKAVTGPDTLQTIAWFTPQIPVATGPGTYGQLPGLILQVSAGEMTITAKEITMELDDPTLITAPDKGRWVTEEEFEVIREEKMDEMNQQNSAHRTSGNLQRIRIGG
jgi:GLPGLI family protein